MKAMGRRHCSDRIACLIVSVVLALVSFGCAKQRHLVIAATGTNIGVEISENPATQAPQAKLGYQRTELAIVPTNRSTADSASGGSLNEGAKDVADVIMELRYGGIFDRGETSGIYQRLAVGTTAVRQPGASLMFAKDAGGTVTPDAQRALKAVMAIPVDDIPSRSSMKCLGEHRKDAPKAKLIDSAIGKVTKSEKDPNGLTWDELVDNPDPKVVGSVLDELKKNSITCP